MIRKKTINFFIIVIFFILFSGFRGCQTLYDILELYYTHSVSSTKFTGNDNISEIYHISVGDSGKIYTASGRQPDEWILQESGTSRDLQYVKMYSTEDSIITFAVGKSGTIIHSTNAGISWQNISVSNNNFPDLYGFDFTDIPPGHITHIVAAGDSGKIVRTQYSGNNWSWQQFTVSPPRNLRAIIAVSPIIWIAAGEQGSLYRSANSGNNWTFINLNVPETMNRFARISFNTYIVVGNGGKIFKSTNYGVSWSPMTSGTTNNLRDVYFKNSTDGIAVGDNGTSRHTTDGGETWLQDSFLNGITTNNIISVSQVDSSTGLSATRETSTGDNTPGTRFIFVSSEPFIGISPVSDFIPAFFSLKQNFPNPFNPVTKISFDIPPGKNQNVKLTVFDLSGKELDVIVNEKLGAGRYEAEWNGWKYSSGVYFYRIQADVFTETKKMILVK